MRLRGRLTYANIASTLALLIALTGGTAYAMARIGSAAVIDNSLRSVDIHNRTLQGLDVAAGTLTGRNVKNGSLPLSKLSGVTRIATRTHLAASLTTGTTPATLDLTGAGWRQGPGEVDLLAIRATADSPTQCTPAGGFAGADVIVTIDGASSSTGVHLPFDSGGGPVEATAFITNNFLFEPGTATPHTLTAKASDECFGGGDGHFVLHDVQVDVIAIR